MAEVDPWSELPPPQKSRFKETDWAWHIITLLWMIGGGLSVFGIITMLGSLFSGLVILLVGIGIAAIGGLMFFAGLRIIRANPKHRGVLTVWGERVPVIIDEGERFLPDYFPFRRSAIEVNVVTQNHDTTIDQIPTNELGYKVPNLLQGPGEDEGKTLRFKVETTVKADVSLTYEPDYSDDDPHRLIDYLDKGGKEGVFDNVKDLIRRYLRHLGQRNTAKRCIQSNTQFTLFLIKYLTGEEPGVNGLPEGLPPDYREFFDVMRDKGLKDQHRLGIRFKRIDITRIYYETEAMKKVAEGRLLEKLQRRKELADVDTEIEITGKYIKQGIPPMEAANLAQSVRGRGRRQTFYANPEAGGILAALAAIGAMDEDGKPKKPRNK